MASFVFNQTKEAVANAGINFIADNTFKISLVTEDFFNDTNVYTYTQWSDVSQYEIAGEPTNTGYTSGLFLTGVDDREEAVAGGTITNTVVYANDINYSNTSSITARGAVIYLGGNNSLVLAIDFGADITSSYGLFTIRLNEYGFLKIR